jgi:hypothetical protein
MDHQVRCRSTSTRSFKQYNNLRSTRTLIQTPIVLAILTAINRCLMMQAYLAKAATLEAAMRVTSRFKIRQPFLTLRYL